MSLLQTTKKYMIPLYIQYRERREGGEPENPSNKWSSKTPETIHLELQSVYFERKENDFFPRDQINVSEELMDAKRIFLVVARYSDGDTFGMTYGKFFFVNAFSSLQEAKDCDPASEVKRIYGYVPWHSYFSGGRYAKEVYCFDMTLDGACWRQFYEGCDY